MKSLIITVLVSLMAFSAFAGIAPYSERVGVVCTEIVEGSVEAMVLEALSKEFTLSWIDMYTAGGDAFLEAYSPLLSSILPMSSMVIGRSDGNGVAVYSQNSEITLYITIKEGSISALQKR